MSMFIVLYKPLGLVDALRQLIAEHPMLALAAVLILVFAMFNAFVQALPKPDTSNGKGYWFFFKFMHACAFNFQYALRKKFPEYVPESVPETDGKGES